MDLVILVCPTDKKLNQSLCIEDSKKHSDIRHNA